MTSEDIEANNQIISYRTLRRLIGWIGVLLPLILIIGLSFFENSDTIQDSISDYYGTKMRDFFVGFLFVLSFFLLSYKGYKENEDNFIANLGALFALGIALFPTTHPYKSVRIIHFVSAVLLFAVFVYFCLVIFRRRLPDPHCTEMKCVRNRIYLVCGIIIIIAIALAGTSFYFIDEKIRNQYNLIFWLEAIALWAFGFSWLTKGGLFFKDKGDSIKLFE